ncbi:MAG: hypothetical protein RLZZ227_2452 [Pseudomonadota bacterium]|jgi:Cu-Zn family superoxide dismutase
MHPRFFMQMKRQVPLLFATLFLPGMAGAASDAQLIVQMNRVTDAGVTEPLGEILIVDVAHGVELRPALTGLAPGQHGFHVHEFGSCDPGIDESGKAVAAHSAGEHYDPDGADQHGSPLANDGHKGDLPILNVGADGRATIVMQASRLRIDDLAGRALIIHAGGDNFTDVPPNGGGGARVACGVIPGQPEALPLPQSAQ